MPRLRVHSNCGSHTPGDWQGQLPSAAAEIDGDVVTGQAEGADQPVDHR
jgi:hypothetical protein